MRRDPDLFAWAATRPTATVIDAVRKFDEREAIRIMQLPDDCSHPTSGGSPPVSLDEARLAKAQARQARQDQWLRNKRARLAQPAQQPVEPPTERQA
jgi:hypothetical protein